MIRNARWRSFCSVRNCLGIGDVVCMNKQECSRQAWLRKGLIGPERRLPKECARSSTLKWVLVMSPKGKLQNIVGPIFIPDPFRHDYTVSLPHPPLVTVGGVTGTV